MAKNHNRNSSWGRSNMAVAEHQKSAPAIGQPIALKLPAPPPNEIFKFRKNRLAPAQEIWGTGSISYIPERFEHVEGEGNFVYYVGCPFPAKTIAPVESIYAVNPIKRRLINMLRLLASREMRVPLVSLLFVGKRVRAALLNRVLDLFNDEAALTATPFYLEKGYYCKFVKEVQKFLKTFFTALGAEEEIADVFAENVGLCIENDNAYRFRGQDVGSEASKEALLKDFPGEIERLLALEAERDHITTNNDVREKFRKGAIVMKYIWRVPSLRKALREAIEAVDFEAAKLDEADIYHMLLYGDYDVKGMNQEERFKLYEKYHGPDQNKWPPRIMVRNKTA